MKRTSCATNKKYCSQCLPVSPVFAFRNLNGCYHTQVVAGFQISRPEVVTSVGRAITALALVAVARKLIGQWYGRDLFRKMPSFLWCHTDSAFLRSSVLPSASASSLTIC